MKYSVVLAIAALVAEAAAAPGLAARHVQHEKRSVIPSGWAKRSKLESRRILPMKVALKQSNMENIEDFLMDVSHPESKNYGKHWSHKTIAETFAPSHETVKAVHDWLISAGIPKERIQKSQSMGWLHFDATVEEAEALLKTEYHLYEHEQSGQGQVACTEYHVPEHVQHHVDFITPTVHFDAKIIDPNGPLGDLEKRHLVERNVKGLGLPGQGSLPKIQENNNFKNIINDLKDCSNNVTPDCLRALYKFPALPSFFPTNPKNSYGIVEYTPQSYIGSDLDLFFGNYSKNQVQKRPILDSVDGGSISDTQDLNLNAESDLDLEYAMALVNPLKVTLYQVGDVPEQAATSFNNFLDALDASYCAGDDPNFDASFPDPAPGGYKGPENCGGFAATKVISTSYGYNEADLTPAYEIRQCNEYAKLGLAGTTFLFSSGDYGVAGNGGQCIDPATGAYNDGTSGKFNPSFPGGCPYILSVGATQIAPNASVTAPETACETVIYSGGGFSNVFPMPKYQKAAVEHYIDTVPIPYGADRYNNSGMVRAFPDVSANGAKYVVALDGGYKYHLYGTSASSPTFGSILTLINEVRLDAGKSPLGFVNPALYAHPNMLNDIVTGGNQGCGTPGFQSAKGWDPVTGLGTPNYLKMLAYFLGDDSSEGNDN
jgi:tripeptidyl-peptidase-1